MRVKYVYWIGRFIGTSLYLIPIQKKKLCDTMLNELVSEQIYSFYYGDSIYIIEQ